MQFSMNMDAAPRDELLVLAIPTGDPEDPLVISLGEWNEDAGLWDGAWRGDDGETYADMDPVAWHVVAEPSEELLQKAVEIGLGVGLGVEAAEVA